MAEIRRFTAGGVTSAELATARAYRAGALAMNMQTPAEVSRAVATAVEAGLPADNHAREYYDVLTVPAAEVDAAAASLLHPDRLAVVVEGDPGTGLDRYASVLDGPRAV